MNRDCSFAECEKPLPLVKPNACSTSSRAALAVDTCGGGFVKSLSSCIEEAVRKRFEPWELTRIKCGALQEYNLLKNASERRELEREESAARENLVDDATFFLAAIVEWHVEARAGLLDDGALRLLLSRLRGRAAADERRAEAHEAALREAGRQEWRRAVAEKAAAAEREAAMERWRRECEGSLRAAAAFLMGAETRDRRCEEGAEAAAWAELCAEEVRGREEAERLAYENFMNSPEQVALRKEEERIQAAANRAAARQLKRFLKEQEHLVKSCRHARGNTSIFEGPSPKRVCVSCGVKFDETLGYYVRMRGHTIPPPATWTPPPPPPTSRRGTSMLPPIPAAPKDKGNRKMTGGELNVSAKPKRMSGVKKA